MIIQEVKVVYYDKYEGTATAYLYVIAPVNEEKVERYCSKILREYKELVSFDPLCSYKIEEDDSLIDFINSIPATRMEPYYPFIEGENYAKKM